jgi:integrase/recombinase XerD
MKSPVVLASFLAPTISRYLALKKALGRGFDYETNVLARLDGYLVRAAPSATALTADAFTAWTLTFEHLSPTVRRNWMRIARNLCLYSQRGEPGCFVPDAALFPAPHPRSLPYIFTEQDIVKLLRAAAELRTRPISPLCAVGFRLAIVLLYTCGLRRGELVRLLVSDYDAVERTLLIRVSKFHKSRLVALSHDAAQEMDRYLVARRRIPCAVDSPLLTTRFNGRRPYTGESFGFSLHRLFLRAGILTAHGKPPRVHDLRHTYAVHALLRWYRAGVDVQTKLPALAAAMGHVSIVSTAYYLSFFPPIAEAASERFARHCKPVLNGIGGGEP